MAVVMVERDAVLAAVRALTREALAARGGALFVVGEAGLGKTTVLEYAVATAGARFTVGTGRADVAEAALPFGLIGQALDAVLGSPAGPAGPAGTSWPRLWRSISTRSWPGCGRLAGRSCWRWTTRTGPTRTR